MTYIILLGLLVSGVIAGLFDNSPVSDLVNRLKGNITEFSFPKNQNEIVINKVQEQYKTMERFFGTSANELIKSKTVPEKEKQAIREAFQAFQETKELITELEEQTDTNIVETAIKKVLKLDQASPTSIPPQCQVVCPK